MNDTLSTILFIVFVLSPIVGLLSHGMVGLFWGIIISVFGGLGGALLLKELELFMKKSDRTYE